MLFRFSEQFNMGDLENDQISTMREFMKQMNKLTEICFDDCIWDFTTRKISGLENQCSLYCAEKYLKMNQRVSTRFQEFQVMSNENALAAIKRAG